MADISIHSKFSSLLELLIEAESESGGQAFKTFRDVIKFASVLGMRGEVTVESDNRGRVIPFRVFENSKDHELIWLVALVETKDVDILRRDEYRDNETEAVGIFQGYANGGLEVIWAWLENKAPSEYFDVILGKISESLSAEIEVEDAPIRF